LDDSPLFIRRKPGGQRFRFSAGPRCHQLLDRPGLNDWFANEVPESRLNQGAPAFRPLLRVRLED
jgi:hypothetical protein